MEVIKVWECGSNTYTFSRKFTSKGHYEFYLTDITGTLVEIIMYRAMGSFATRSGIDFDIRVLADTEFVLPSSVLRELQKIIWNINLFKKFTAEGIERVLDERKCKDRKGLEDRFIS